MALWTLALLNGLVWGFLWALLALGLSLIYGTLGLINLAHGAFYMLGALLGWALTPALGFTGALLAAPLVVGALGFASERFLLASKRSQNGVTALLITFALMLILQQGATIFLQITTGELRHFVTPPVRWPLALGDFFYEGYRVLAAGIALMVLVGVWALLRYTTWGRWLRAVRTNDELALSLGIPVPWVRAGAFGLGAALAALAGALVGPIVREVQPTMGIEVLLVSVLIAVAGGLGNLVGALTVAFLYSLTENLLTVLADPALARAGALTAIGLLLLFRSRIQLL
ncbi:MAG: branched-chain amino acid ABC transporter permease [Candidatus Bipolaricaulota bacterium]|nr:branched-chain amino acid ABC transporter permease [Candidatus Bipolaricaulota bacterium]MDW8111504.1 branched-chain amino acid ABC transporter permease [Candidatus Bipolaricaulota bacterium]MDW8329843.1 branched-chain amino acid ABC transporter permease [Candidatus Bipolaricaulota bacterium]